MLWLSTPKELAISAKLIRNDTLKSSDFILAFMFQTQCLMETQPPKMSERRNWFPSLIQQAGAKKFEEPLLDYMDNSTGAV